MLYVEWQFENDTFGDPSSRSQCRVVSPLGTMELTAEFQTNVVQSFPEGTRTTGWGRGGSCVPAPVEEFWLNQDYRKDRLQSDIPRAGSTWQNQMAGDKCNKRSNRKQGYLAFRRIFRRRKPCPARLYSWKRTRKPSSNNSLNPVLCWGMSDGTTAAVKSEELYTYLNKVIKEEK